MAEAISIERFRELFVIDSEFAVIDPRSAVDFAAGHLLAASNLPLQQLDSLISPAVPLKSTLCVFCDAGAGEAASAAAQLESLGYSNVAILDGGLEAWRVSGGVVFSGVGVPGKAFGEFIESECATPVMTAAQLRARQQSDAKTLLIDSRTAEEHASYCIPGAVLCPGAELVYRVLPMIDEDTDIVVHCGGRTRSIIGAQTLIDAGCERVYALENGTMAWQFEGLELEHGNQSALPKPEAGALPGIREVAARMAETLVRRSRQIDSPADHGQPLPGRCAQPRGIRSGAYSRCVARAGRSPAAECRSLPGGAQRDGHPHRCRPRARE